MNANRKHCKIRRLFALSTQRFKRTVGAELMNIIQTEQQQKPTKDERSGQYEMEVLMSNMP